MCAPPRARRSATPGDGCEAHDGRRKPRAARDGHNATVDNARVHGPDGWQETPVDDLSPRLGGAHPPAAWVHVAGLDALVGAARRAGVPEQLVRRAVRTPGGHDLHRAQLRRLPDGVRYLVSPTLRWDPATRQVTTGMWAALVVGGITLTAEEGDAALVDEVVERLEGDDHLPDEAESQVFAAAVMSLVGRASDVEVGIGEAVADTEKVVFRRADRGVSAQQARDAAGQDPSDPADPAQRVYDLKREIAEARRALVPLLSAFPDLVAEQEESRAQDRTTRWLGRLDTALGKVDRHLDAHDDLLGDMLSVYLSQVSVRQNEDMRKISAWAAIIAVPTLIAGIYGMNFRHMPELHWLLGYPAALVLMAGVCLGLFRLFKRSGWL